MCSTDRMDVTGPRDVDPRSDHVVEARARLGERALDDPETDHRLLIGVGRRVGVVRKDRRRARYPDIRTDANGPGVANPFLERSPRGDSRPLHRDILAPAPDHVRSFQPVSG
jgi:hypothetical protein